MKEIEGIGKLFTAEDLSKILDVSTFTVMRRYRTGELKGRKFGKNILFLETSLKEFLSGSDQEAKPVKKRAKKTEQINQVKAGPEIEQESFHLFKQVEPASNSDLVEIKADPEKEQIREIKEAMKKTGNNQTQTANLLNIARQTLIRRIKKYNLSFPKN